MQVLPRASRRDRASEEIYRLIRAATSLSRADLTERTGLPASTISHALAELVTDGRIEKSLPQPKGPGSGSGRPGASYRARPTGRHLGAIDFGHAHIRMAIGDDLGEPVDEILVGLDVDLNAQEAMDLAGRHMRELQRAHGIEHLTSVVAGIPGPVDRETGLVCSATILSSWVGLDPAQELSQRIGAPVHVENDAALGAYGELMRGSGEGFRDFLYVKAAHGIGAGLILNGAPYHGYSGVAGEIGHTTLAGRTDLCRCGNTGCLEAVVSIATVLEQIRHTHPGMNLDDVSLADLDDAVSLRILENAGRWLGIVLAVTVNLINPAAIIVGGDLGDAGESLLGAVRTAITQFSQPAAVAGLVIAPAALGTRAELVGALQLARLRDASAVALAQP
jgi:predicted NBD/HSP70 family sugar kinase